MNSKESNVVILARVSSKAQEDEGYSLDSQLKLLMGYCEQRELNIIKIFKIAETASKEQRRCTVPCAAVDIFVLESSCRNWRSTNTSQRKVKTRSHFGNYQKRFVGQTF